LKNGAPIPIIPHNNVEDNIVVARIAMVSMSLPPAGPDVKLHIPPDLPVPGFDDGMVKVGAT
jgi:hypothetical protein